MPRANPRIIIPELPHKWAGSKRRIARQLFTKFPRGCRRYIEPFYGCGASALTAVASEWAEQYVFSDCNRELVGAHSALPIYADAIVQKLHAFASLSEDEQKKRFLDYRLDTLPLWPYEGGDAMVERAVRFFALVMCGYNGLWRENKSGKYNVPWGQKLRVNEAGIRQCAELLRGATTSLSSCDFADTLACAGEGDLVYCDPPYLPRKKTGGFAYSRGDGWAPEEHERLVRCMREAAQRGARVFATGSNTEETETIYMVGPAKKWYLRSRHSISCKGDDRKVVGELLFEVFGGASVTLWGSIGDALGEHR